MAAWLPEMLSLAALRATLAVFSPSAAITCSTELSSKRFVLFQINIFVSLYLCTGLPSSLGLGGHGSLELDGQTHILPNTTTQCTVLTHGDTRECTVVVWGDTYTSTLSTLTPQGSVATSSVVSM